MDKEIHKEQVLIELFPKYSQVSLITLEYNKIEYLNIKFTSQETQNDSTGHNYKRSILNYTEIIAEVSLKVHSVHSGGQHKIVQEINTRFSKII